MDYNEVMDGSGKWVSSKYSDCNKVKISSVGDPFDTGTLCSQVMVAMLMSCLPSGMCL